MISPAAKRRMDPMDAFFYFGDSEAAPMTIGSVGVFEGRVPFRTFRSRIGARLHLIPRYRQIVVDAPFHLGMPTWENDPDFDIKNHVRQVRLGKNVTEDALAEYAETLFEGRMPMDRPLWEIVLIPDLVGGRTGFVCRVHHCLVDGVGGIGLMHVVFDTSPNPEPIRRRRYRPGPIPDRLSLLYDAVWDSAIDGVEHWTRLQNGLASFGRGKSREQLTASVSEFAEQLGDLLSPTRRLPFNKPFNGARRFAFSELSFAEARAVKAVRGSTINDVALTVLAGAMTDYLERRGQNTLGEELSVVCPVNLRDDEDAADLGNRISFMPVRVPLDIDDPLERLESVTARTRALKERGVPEMIHLFFGALQGLPAAVQRALLSGLTSAQYGRLIDKLPQMPPGHVICTNVPGPQIPLYSCGHRLEKYYPLLPLAFEMGISCGITSYEQKLFFSFMGDGNCAPDVSMLRDCHRQAFEALRTAAGVGQRQYIPLRHVLPTGTGEARIVRTPRMPVAAKSVSSMLGGEPTRQVQ